MDLGVCVGVPLKGYHQTLTTLSPKAIDRVARLASEDVLDASSRAKWVDQNGGAHRQPCHASQGRDLMVWYWLVLLDQGK